MMVFLLRVDRIISSIASNLKRINTTQDSYNQL